MIKKSRELEELYQESGSSDKCRRAHSNQKEKNMRSDGGVINEEPNRKILRTHGECRGEITTSRLSNMSVINHENKRLTPWKILNAKGLRTNLEGSERP